MEDFIERLILHTRWLLLPLYLALFASVIAIYLLVGRELIHLFAAVVAAPETELILIILSILDLVLVANLLVMVAISSYESFISPITSRDDNKPEWLGKLDSGNVKVKVGLSIVMISAIHLLRAFMLDTPPERIQVLAGVHVVFLLSVLAMAFVDKVKK